MRKEALRKIYKQKRAKLSLQEIEVLQAQIYEQVFKFDFSDLQNIHIFLSIKKQQEIATLPIINFLRKKGKTIICSKSNFTTNTLTHYILKEDTLLKQNKYEIPEPENATKFDVKKIDLVFVPLLISDKNNFRVGYGKGFYDRFLVTCKPSVQTIGLNFFKPIEKISNTNTFDIPLQQVIYPKKL